MTTGLGLAQMLGNGPLGWEGHALATGVVHVFVNGVQVLRDGEHTGAKPGKVARGPGWTG
jgi:hypothetical protein